MKSQIFRILILVGFISNLTTKSGFLKRLALLQRKQIVPMPVRSLFLKSPVTAYRVLYYHFQTQESNPTTQCAVANTFLGSIPIDHSFFSAIQKIAPNYSSNLDGENIIPFYRPDPAQINCLYYLWPKTGDKLAPISTAITSVARLLLNPTLVLSRDKAHTSGGKTMEHLIALGLSAYDDDPIDELLAEYEPLIQTEVRKAVRSFSSDGILELEIDELAQAVRIKLWKACQKQSIKNPRAYIMAITRTTAIDIIRRHKPVLSLSNSAYEELGLCDLLMTQKEGFRDPALEIELEEVEPIFLASLIEAILSLPPRQKHAVLLAIKEHQADSYLLIDVLKARGVNIETVSQPEEQSELYLLRASLSVARMKLRALRERAIAV